MSDQDFIKGLENLHHMVCGPPEPERDDRDAEIERLQAECDSSYRQGCADGYASAAIELKDRLNAAEEEARAYEDGMMENVGVVMRFLDAIEDLPEEHYWAVMNKIGYDEIKGGGDAENL